MRLLMRLYDPGAVAYDAEGRGTDVAVGQSHRDAVVVPPLRINNCC